MRFALTRTCSHVCPLSHLLRKCQLSQRESREAGANFLPYAQTKLVSPSGRDVAQRQRGLAPSLRELDLPQAKTEGAASYLSRIRQTLARTRQRAAPSVTACAVPPFSGRKAFVLHANKNRASFDTLSLGGRWWIRFSAEKPRRLQHASSMLPRAGFRIHCSYSQS